LFGRELQVAALQGAAQAPVLFAGQEATIEKKTTQGITIAIFCI
jgi:hypothetical protein